MQKLINLLIVRSTDEAIFAGLKQLNQLLWTSSKNLNIQQDLNNRPW